MNESETRAEYIDPALLAAPGCRTVCPEVKGRDEFFNMLCGQNPTVLNGQAKGTLMCQVW